MNVAITKKQNIRINRVKYKAQEVLGEPRCDSCILSLENCCYKVPCVPSERTDGKDVIFVKAEPKWIAVDGVVPALAPDTEIKWKNAQGDKGRTTAGDLGWRLDEVACKITHYRVVKAWEAA